MRDQVEREEVGPVRRSLRERAQLSNELGGGSGRRALAGNAVRIVDAPEADWRQVGRGQAHVEEIGAAGGKPIEVPLERPVQEDVARSYAEATAAAALLVASSEDESGVSEIVTVSRQRGASAPALAAEVDGCKTGHGTVISRGGTVACSGNPAST
jgi:hypothetical protein